MDLKKKKEQQERAQEEKQRKEAEQEAQEKSKRASTSCDASRQLSEQLANKRTAQGDIFTRLAEVDVQQQTARRKLLKEGLALASSDAIFRSGLRSESATSTPAGKPTPKASRPSSANGSKHSSSTNSSSMLTKSPEGGVEMSNSIVTRLFDEGTQKMRDRQRSRPPEQTAPFSLPCTYIRSLLRAKVLGSLACARAGVRRTLLT